MKVAIHIHGLNLVARPHVLPMLRHSLMALLWSNLMHGLIPIWHHSQIVVMHCVNGLLKQAVWQVAQIDGIKKIKQV